MHVEPIRLTESTTLSVSSQLQTSVKFLSLHFKGHFSRWTWVSRYQNVSILDFIGAKMMQMECWHESFQ